MTNKELVERLREHALMVDGFLQSIVSRVTTHKEFKDAQNELAKIMDIAAALEAQPEGYVLVPREPTEAMMLAGMEVVPMVKQYADIGSKSVYKGSISSAIGHLECGELYRAMLAAAPAGGKPSSTT